MKKFTLIELLVVIAIIGILVSILLPSLMKARRHAKVAVCLSQLKQLGTSMHLYVKNNDGMFPLSSIFQPAYNLLGKQGSYWAASGTHEQRPLNWYEAAPVSRCPLDVENAYADNLVTADMLGSTYMSSQTHEWWLYQNDLKGDGTGQRIEKINNAATMVFMTSFAGYHMGRYPDWNDNVRPTSYFHNPSKPIYPFVFVDGRVKQHTMTKDMGFQHSRDILDFTNDP